MILVILVPVICRMPRVNTRSGPYISRCMAEAQKTHRMADHQILASFTYSFGDEAVVSFGFREDKTEQDWNCECNFDKSGNLVSIAMVPAK
jgi:hypothetical protein